MISKAPTKNPLVCYSLSNFNMSWSTISICKIFYFDLVVVKFGYIFLADRMYEEGGCEGKEGEEGP